jgi:hypothetical protein
MPEADKQDFEPFITMAVVKYRAPYQMERTPVIAVVSHIPTGVGTYFFSAFDARRFASDLQKLADQLDPPKKEGQAVEPFSPVLAAIKKHFPLKARKRSKKSKVRKSRRK